MLTIVGRNVNEVYCDALWKMNMMGVPAQSRNGPVKRIPGPVASTYRKPTERMLLDTRRDANPFFHIFEAAWMLAGRNDVKWLERFNHNISTYSDDGEVLHGAYGYRWRRHFGHDQLFWAIQTLVQDNDSRRVVLQMFDPIYDQYNYSKDIPCNTAVYLDIAWGHLNMTVSNRSNDIIWGAYGANVVHMSVLQELIAKACDVPVGEYTQISNNFHIYEKHWPLMECPHEAERYTYDVVASHVPPVRSQATWQEDLLSIEAWCDEPREGSASNNPWVYGVLDPMFLSYQCYKSKNQEGAEQYAEQILDLEVRMACERWLARRNWEVEVAA